MRPTTSNVVWPHPFDFKQVFRCSTPPRRGGYTGNPLAPQAALERVLARQFDGLDILKQICSEVLSQHIAARYEGPLGVGMMLVKMAQGIMLHPCIEVNLRRTMGYVALDVARAEYDLPSVLRPLFGWS